MEVQPAEPIPTLLDELYELPAETEREYEIRLTALSQSPDKQSMREELRKILENGAVADNTRYAAFYCLSIIYRRNKDFSLLEELINRYEHVFRRHTTYAHIQALYLKEKGMDHNALFVIQKTYETYQNIPQNAGIVHNFAETVVQAYEDGDASTREIIRESWLDKADFAINKAIELDPAYAKYYCTRGRLLAVRGKYGEARIAIKRAIDIEDSKKKDYVIRLGNYQYYLLLVQSEENRGLMDRELAKHQAWVDEANKDIERKMHDNSMKNLEYLVFFTAIMSFIIGTIQFAAKQEAHDSIRLIIALCAALLAAFSGFGIILHGFSKKSMPSILVCMASAVILGMMYFL